MFKHLYLNVVMVRSMSVEYVGIDLFFKRSSHRLGLGKAEVVDVRSAPQIQSLL